jgi:ATP-dependent DNA helicase DinG
MRYHLNVTATWRQQFQPITERRGLGVRSGQEKLGQAIIDAIEAKKPLIAEAPTGTGKSMAALIPAIHAVKERGLRVAVSTETTALQDQYVTQDLPLLHGVYGGFTFRALKGRSWYMCFNRAKTSTYGRRDFGELVKTLERLPRQRLGDGERGDVESALGRRLTQDEWDALASEANFCGEAQCKDEDCFSSRARTLALGANIVICNNALLRTDADMQSGDFDADGLLGKVDVLIVDEAHTLEASLIDGWKREVTPWGLLEARSAITDGLEKAATVTEVGATADEVSRGFDALFDFLSSAARFYRLMHNADGKSDEEWKRSDWAVREYWLSGRPDAALLRAMQDYEENAVVRLRQIDTALERAERVLKNGVDRAVDSGVKGVRKIRKGLRLAKELRSDVSFLSEAIKTRDGIVVSFGVPYGIIARGRSHPRFGDQVTLEIIPIDVSARAQRSIWNGRIPILVSATLADPITPGDFRYVAASLGLGDIATLMVESPFSHADQQLVYVTPATDEVVPVQGARFAMDELVRVLEATRGRALVLFTSVAELEHAAQELRWMQGRGEFHHTLLVQEKGVDKQELADAFRDEESSVLLASKSFMTGVNFAGSTCSAVVMAKFTLPNFNALCRMQIEWWRRRSFPAWYDRQALLTFSQAMGRLIRAEDDHGVVALLDQRLANERERVSATARIGIAATGSRVTNDLHEVVDFLR